MFAAANSYTEMRAVWPGQLLLIDTAVVAILNKPLKKITCHPTAHWKHTLSYVISEVIWQETYLIHKEKPHHLDKRFIVSPFSCHAVPFFLKQKKKKFAPHPNEGSSQKETQKLLPPPLKMTHKRKHKSGVVNTSFGALSTKQFHHFSSTTTNIMFFSVWHKKSQAQIISSSRFLFPNKSNLPVRQTYWSCQDNVDILQLKVIIKFSVSCQLFAFHTQRSEFFLPVFVPFTA